MLCSVPTTGTSGTTSNWLDRLRSSRGLPAADDTLGLDHYLNSNDDCQCSTTTDESTQSNDSRLDHRPPPSKWLEIELILSDLFNVSDPRRAPGRRPKGLRKQPNPRFCQADDRSSGCGRKDDEAALASAASLNCSGDDEEEMERGRGYSRSEVTVIDTSCEGWKFEKVVYRRKDVWKVRNMKGRPSCAGGLKKRKRSGLDWTVNGNGDSKKKKGKVLENPRLGFEDNGAGGGIVGTTENDVQDQQEEKTEETCKESRNDNCQVSESRSHLSRSSVKLKKTGSSRNVVKYPPGNVKKGKKLYKNLIKGGG